jgi:hypothetical protein
MQNIHLEGQIGSINSQVFLIFLFIVWFDIMLRKDVWRFNNSWRRFSIAVVLMAQLTWVSFGLCGFLYLCDKSLLPHWCLLLVAYWRIVLFTLNCFAACRNHLCFILFDLRLLLRGLCDRLLNTFNLQRSLCCFLLNNKLWLADFAIQIAYYVIEIERFLANAKRIDSGFVHFK